MAIKKCIILIVYLVVFMLASCVKQHDIDDLYSELTEPPLFSASPTLDEVEEAISNTLCKDASGESNDDAFVIMTNEINSSLEMVFPIFEEINFPSFTSDDIEYIEITESREDGYYELRFELTPGAIEKTVPCKDNFPTGSIESDFPMSVSINGETFDYITRAYKHNPLEDIFMAGLFCPLNEDYDTREDLKNLFTK